ncbi:MAG: c-type cytochrome [Myxococcales bacterium]|nr:c-type cytochrome [Myxococcales bacterium]
MTFARWLLALGACRPDVGTGTQEPVTVTGVSTGTPVAPVGDLPSVPLYGGTLAVQGGLAVAADPGLDVVAFWEVGQDTLAGRVHLSPGSQPFRVAFSGEHVLVTLRGSGSVAVIDAASRTLVEEVPVCLEPRGVDAQGSVAFVACAGGELVELSQGRVVRARHVRSDLRDVVLDGDHLWVSRFRTAEVLRLEPLSLAVEDEIAIDLVHTAQYEAVPRVAWRMRRHPEGGAVVLHQAHSRRPVASSGGPGGPAYGGGDDCGGPQQVVTSHLTRMFPEGGHLAGGGLVGINLALDFDLSESGRVAVLATANTRDRAMAGPGLVRTVSGLGPSGCMGTEQLDVAPGFPTSVALLEDRRPVGYARNGSFLFEGDTWVGVTNAAGEAPLSTPVAVFHAGPPGSITCASCHPEGQDDGHVWGFQHQGPRRTQNLSGGVAERAPFHWDGSLSSMVDLMDAIFVRRMGGQRLQDEVVHDLADWLDDIEPVRVDTSWTASELAEGEALFTSDRLGCLQCHHGPQLSDHQLHAVRAGGALRKTPSLRAVGYRAPYMHDGCAVTLEMRFTDPSCGGGDLHGTTSHLEPTEIRALVAYLRSL